MKPLIIPAILAPDAADALKKIHQVEEVAPWIQIDALDGSLIKNTSWHAARDLKELDLKPSIELHLMVDNPKRMIDEWRQVPNLKRVVWHVEAPIDHASLIVECRAHGLEVGLALNPATPLETVLPFVNKLDEILVLGVDPGQSGQELQEFSILKIQELHRQASHLDLGFDGGVRPTHFRTLIEAGATYLYVASAIFRDEDPASLLQTQQAFLDALTVPS
jgi:ribulose-phosphate 3-epimerase